MAQNSEAPNALLYSASQQTAPNSPTGQADKILNCKLFSPLLVFVGLAEPDKGLPSCQQEAADILWPTFTVTLI